MIVNTRVSQSALSILFSARYCCGNQINNTYFNTTALNTTALYITHNWCLYRHSSLTYWLILNMYINWSNVNDFSGLLLNGTSIAIIIQWPNAQVWKKFTWTQNYKINSTKNIEKVIKKIKQLEIPKANLNLEVQKNAYKLEFLKKIPIALHCSGIIDIVVVLSNNIN